MIYPIPKQIYPIVKIISANQVWLSGIPAYFNIHRIDKNKRYENNARPNVHLVFDSNAKSRELFSYKFKHDKPYTLRSWLTLSFSRSKWILNFDLDRSKEICVNLNEDNSYEGVLARASCVLLLCELDLPQASLTSGGRSRCVVFCVIVFWSSVSVESFFELVRCRLSSMFRRWLCVPNTLGRDCLLDLLSLCISPI